MAVDYLGFAFAIIVAIGGVIGYFKADSVPSLISGLAFGAVLGYGAYRLTQDPTDIYLSLAASIILAGLMGWRFYASGKFMPAGLITFLSVAMILKLFYTGITNYLASRQ